MGKGVVGSPQYKKGDKVVFGFEWRDGSEQEMTGAVYIVDAYGTFEQNEEPSYDIMVEDFRDSGEPCLVKHIRESSVKGLAE